jgi:hypothetical protein
MLRLASLWGSTHPNTTSKQRSSATANRGRLIADLRRKLPIVALPRCSMTQKPLRSHPTWTTSYQRGATPQRRLVELFTTLPV